MRISTIFIAILISVTSIFAQNDNKKYIQPRESTVGVYANQIRHVYEEALFKVTPDDRLLVLEEKDGFYKVQSTEGQKGWIEKRLCINLGRSKTIKFDNQDITAYLDNPTLVSIFGGDNPGEEPIFLNRSFKDALRENIDQENIKRQVTN